MAPEAVVGMDWKEFRRLDGNAVAHGVSIRQLMQNAGKALAEAAAALGPPPYVFLCGKGNNGGDGYAAALLLNDAHVVAVEPPTGSDAQFFALQCTAERLAELPEPGTIIDCLLGSGLVGEPRGAVADAIAWINAKSAPVLSCDVPSGWGSKLVARSDHVLSFHAAKAGVPAEVADIGIPSEAATQIGPGDWQVAVPARGNHKTTNGRLLIVAGGPFVGAPYFAAMAAYRMGCDLVRVAVPGRGAEVQAFGPEPIVQTLPGERFMDAHVEGLPLDWADAVLVGPGLGPGVDDAVVALVRAFEGPMVLDADALSLPAELSRDNMVFTPHAAERKRMAGAFAGTVVETGKVDAVTHPARPARTCHLGHPGMTVGGTGDVLAGAIAALLSQGVEAYDAACAALYIVNKAGESAADIHGIGLLPMDVVEQIGRQMARQSSRQAKA